MTIKAEITTVALGSISFQGLMNENGEFGIAVPQIAEEFQLDKSQASRQLKTLLGKGLQFDKWKTPLNPKSVNVLGLVSFEKLIFEMALKGNPTAINVSRALIGLSLHQLFSDAFGLKFEKEDRQKWLTTRLVTKHDFRPLTDQLKRYGFNEGKDYARFVWAFQSKLGIESGTRDNLSTAKLVELQGMQVKLISYMECGLSPWKALYKIKCDTLFQKFLEMQ
jgi:hypothetical protein